MGLDMYAYATADTFDAEVDFTPKTAAEIAYWRKHPNLHGWMENLYYAKGGHDIDFNCANVALTAEDLDRLEADIRANALPFTEGFFFGESDGPRSKATSPSSQPRARPSPKGRRCFTHPGGEPRQPTTSRPATGGSAVPSRPAQAGVPPGATDIEQSDKPLCLKPRFLKTA